MTNNNNHNHNQSRLLSEGLEASDLANLVDSRVTVDEFKSKIGSDEEIVVLSFTVQGKDPALDLVNFIEKSYDWVLDADASSGELDDGSYMVFVECDREPTLADQLVEMFSDLANLTDIKTEEWAIAYPKLHETAAVDAEELRAMIPLTVADYQDKFRKQQQDLDKLKNAAGIRVETRAPKNNFTESLRIAAGIR